MGYAAIQEAGGEVLLISGDDVKTLEKFRKQKGPGLRYVSDGKGRLMELYGVKMPIVSIANRTTFVIASSGRIEAVFTGGEAIDARGALRAVEQIGADRGARHKAP